MTEIERFAVGYIAVIFIGLTGLVVFFSITVFQAALPQWGLLLLLPLTALIVSCVHALPVLILYRGDREESRENG